MVTVAMKNKLKEVLVSDEATIGRRDWIQSDHELDIAHGGQRAEQMILQPNTHVRFYKVDAKHRTYSISPHLDYVFRKRQTSLSAERIYCSTPRLYFVVFGISIDPVCKPRSIQNTQRWLCCLRESGSTMVHQF